MSESHGGWRVMSRVHKELELGDIQNGIGTHQENWKVVMQTRIFFSGSPTRKKIRV